MANTWDTTEAAVPCCPRTPGAPAWQCQPQQLQACWDELACLLVNMAKAAAANLHTTHTRHGIQRSSQGLQRNRQTYRKDSRGTVRRCTLCKFAVHSLALFVGVTHNTAYIQVICCHWPVPKVKASTALTIVTTLLANVSHLCWELLLWDVRQEALCVNVHSVAARGLNNGHTSVTQQTGQQLNLPAQSHTKTAGTMSACFTHVNACAGQLSTHDNRLSPAP